MPESVDRLKPGHNTVNRGQFSECLLFHLEISLNVTIGGFQALVAKPKSDDSYADTGLEEVHGRGVSQGIFVLLMILVP
jgi:hypothetical protein